MSWREQIRYIDSGEPVSAEIANRPVTDVAERTAELRRYLENIEAGRALVLADQAVEATVPDGAAVYFDEDGVWKTAYLAFATEQGRPFLSRCSLAAGILLRRTSEETGDILLYGQAELPASFEARLDGGYQPGLYYLTSTPGLLSRQPYGVRIAFVSRTQQGTFLVTAIPDPSALWSEHGHFRHELAWTPAGKAKWQGDRFVVEDPDPALRGWLPADPLYFDSIPPGAKFGYNLAQDERLQSLWPLLDPYGCRLELNGLGLENSLAMVTRSGIWWFSDSWGEVPWGTEEGSSFPEEERTLTLWASIFPLGDLLRGVSSLASVDPFLKVEDSAGNEARQGDLQLRLEFTPEVYDGSPQGAALAAYEADLRRFRTTPIVSRIKSTSSAIVISADEQDGEGYGRGSVEISFIDPSTSREGELLLIALDNVYEEDLNGILYLRFPYTQPCGITGKLRLPSTIPDGSKIRFTFWMLALAAGQLPDFTLEVLRVPVAGSNPQTLPLIWNGVTLPMPTTPLAVNQYLAVDSDLVDVSPGDLLYFRLLRPGDDFYGDIGLLLSGWKIE